MGKRLPGPGRRIDAQLRVAAGLQWWPAPTLMRLHDRYGPVVQFGARPFAFVALFGADANKFILADRADAFRWRDAFEMLVPVDGETALVVSDGAEHKRRRRLVQPAFHTKRINGYLELMVEEADRTIDTWSTGRELKAYDDLRRTVRRIVVRALFGDALRERADEIGDTLEPAIAFVNKRLTQQIKIDLPWTAYHRCKTARSLTDDIVDAEVSRRRAMGAADTGDDILAMLLSVVDDEGDPALTGQEIRDQVVSLIAAGYDTTSGAIAWALRAMLDEPGVWDKAKAEVDEIAGGHPPTVDHLQAMRYLDGVVNETLRLWPPAFLSGRGVADDIEFAGHRIRAGTLVVYSPWVTHRLPELWPEPDAFRPERWEHEPLPYSYVPFGGGYRRCIGFAFALLELKAILVRVLQRVDLELRSAGGALAGTAALHPKSGVPVRVLAQN